MTKNAHIPATSALAASSTDYRYRALLRRANVIMPNFTPPASARYYDIYPIVEEKNRIRAEPGHGCSADTQSR
ncbi:MAG: hypothetical protein U5P10_08495 [Spirochaetia bacterium]|nr:hypothetical protein [Spirochaetia bacterium]